MVKLGYCNKTMVNLWNYGFTLNMIEIVKTYFVQAALTIFKDIN